MTHVPEHAYRITCPDMQEDVLVNSGNPRVSWPVKTTADFTMEDLMAAGNLLLSAMLLEYHLSVDW